MDQEQTQKLLALLEEIRDGQRLMIERQAQALARQEEIIARQRERQAGHLGAADQILAQADQLQRKTGRRANRAFLVLFFTVFLALFAVMLASRWVFGHAGA
jgi:hypothetical protein